MKLIIKGNPIPQRRPEVRVYGGRVMGYDPSAKQKKEVIEYLQWTYRGLGENLIIDKPIKINLVAYMPIPASLSKKKQLELDGQYHIKRPDWDNIYKFYTDVLESLVYGKDENICDSSGSKIYSFDPRVEITIEEL